MPQLDTVTFLPQLFWLVCIYASFYLFLTKYILPPITKVLYTRAHKALEIQTCQEMSKDVTPLPILQAGEKMTQADQALSDWHIMQQDIFSKHPSFLTEYVRETALDFARTFFAQKYSVHYVTMVSCCVHIPNCSAKTKMFKKQFMHILFPGFKNVKKSDSLKYECRKDLMKFLCPELIPSFPEKTLVAPKAQVPSRQPRKQALFSPQNGAQTTSTTTSSTTGNTATSSTLGVHDSIEDKTLSQSPSLPKSVTPKKPRAKAKPRPKKKDLKKND